MQPIEERRKIESGCFVPLAKFVFVFGLGVLLRQLVHWGDRWGWQDFNLKDGYVGSKFLSSLLYAYDEDAVHAVGFVYFLYGVLVGIACLVALRLLVGKRS